MRTPQSPTKQSDGHPGYPGYPATLGWWTVLLTVAASTTAVVGCGDVHFLPSPFTPQNVELVYSAQEHLTIVRWRVEATAPVDETRFELLGPDGYQPIDFSRSLFTGGVVACGDGTHSCAQYVVRGHYPQRPTAGQFRPVRAVHEFYGELPGAPAKSRTLENSFLMKSFFNFKNDPVFVNLTDYVASDGDYKFPRAFESALWPTAGVCVAETPPDGVVFHPLDLMTGIPPEKPLTAAGRYCVAIRPVPADSGDRAMLQVPIATLPEVVTAQQVLNPPVETSPIIYQVILDLEIPLADRCAEAGAMHREPHGEIHEGRLCRCPQAADHQPVARLPPAQRPHGRGRPDSGRRQADRRVVHRGPSPVPPPVLQQRGWVSAAAADPDIRGAVRRARRAAPGHTLQTFAWLFSPPTTRALSDLPWMYPDPWLTYDDPTFELMLYSYATNTLPFRTQLHSSDVPVQLLSPQDVEAYAGKQIKICSSSPEILPMSSAGPYPIPIFEPSWEITTADPRRTWSGCPNRRRCRRACSSRPRCA